MIKGATVLPSVKMYANMDNYCALNRLILVMAVLFHLFAVRKLRTLMEFFVQMILRRMVALNCVSKMLLLEDQIITK